jgi:hypothetical protein
MAEKHFKGSRFFMDMGLFFKDINSRKWILILFILQMIIAILLSSIGIGAISRAVSGRQRIQEIYDFDAYVIQDKTPPERLQELYVNPNVLNFYEYVKNTIDKQYIMYAYLPEIQENGNIHERRVANKNFLDLNPLSISYGRIFKEEDFLWEKESVVPIIVGYNLQGDFELNKEYRMYFGEYYFEAVVVGIIERNFSYPSLGFLGRTENLDNSYIIPISDSFIQHYAGFGDFHMALTSTIYAPDNTSVLKSIAEKSKEYNLFTLEFAVLDDVLDQYVKEVIPGARTFLILSIIIVIFSFLYLLTQGKKFIIKVKSNDEANSSSGAKQANMSLLFLVEFSVSLLLAYIPTVMLIGFSFYSAYIMLIMFIIIIGISFRLYKKYT